MRIYNPNNLDNANGWFSGPEKLNVSKVEGQG